MAVIYILDTSELIVNDELIDKVEKKRQEKIRRIDNNLIKKEKLGAGLLLKELFDEYGIIDYPYDN